jgi:hypothetical protein
VEEIDELIRQYGLEEDAEHVIIPLTDKNGRKMLRYILKRRYIRIVYGEGYHIDHPLADVIKAMVHHPELPVSRALKLFYEEQEIEMPKPVSDKKDPESKDAYP